MQYDRLVSGLAGVLAAITIVMTILGVAVNPAILFVALPFGAAAYLVYYHASGRMAAKVYRSVQRQAATNSGPGRGRSQRTGRNGGVGAGPREEWVPPRDGASARDAASSGARRERSRRGQPQQERTRRRQGGERRARQRQRASRSTSGPSAAEAYRTLGLDPDADESAVKRAYREKVKNVHPDTDGGDEESFKAVTAAYERLTD